VQVPGPPCPRAPVQILAEPALPGSQGQHAGQDHGRGNGGAFEIGHLVPALREALGGHVVPGQSADPAADEIHQREPVPPSAQAGSEPERRGRDPERDDVRERIQLAPEHRMLMPPAGDTAIEPVEDQRRRRQGRGGEEIGPRLAPHVEHAEKDCRDPAGGVGQRQKVGQVKLADHREVFGGNGGHGGKIYAGCGGMSSQARKPMRLGLEEGGARTRS